jgi:hypothetical protein
MRESPAARAADKTETWKPMKGEPMSNELTDIKNQFLQVGAEARNALGTLLKFKKGHYFVGKGEDEVEVTDETRIAHVEATMRGYVKFFDGKRVAQQIGRVADGYKVPPRKALGDNDESEWELDKATSKRKDPWALQYYLPMEDPENGEIAIFVTGSDGGVEAVLKLCDTFGKNAERGLPVIKLAVTSYNHQDWGRVFKPDLQVISWDSSVIVTPPPASGNPPPASGNPPPAPAKDDPISTGRPRKNDMDDDIPFAPEFR